MKQYVIYIHRNKINNKVYIGQTCNVKRRWENNGVHYKTSPHFWSAIQKYGWNNFEHIILLKDLTSLQADLFEKKFIQLYDATNPLKGYNILSGGNEKLKNYWNLDKSKKKQSEKRIQYFQNNPEAKDLINKNRKKKVKCIETGEIFNSQAEAARAYRINAGNLGKHLKKDKNYSYCGKHPKTGEKLHWINI